MEESEDNDDDVFVVADLTDTGQNLPMAIASFVRWLTAPTEYRLIKESFVHRPSLSPTGGKLNPDYTQLTEVIFRQKK